MFEFAKVPGFGGYTSELKFNAMNGVQVNLDTAASYSTIAISMFPDASQAAIRSAIINAKPSRRTPTVGDGETVESHLCYIKDICLSNVPIKDFYVWVTLVKKSTISVIGCDFIDNLSLSKGIHGNIITTARDAADYENFYKSLRAVDITGFLL